MPHPPVKKAMTKGSSAIEPQLPLILSVFTRTVRYDVQLIKINPDNTCRGLIFLILLSKPVCRAVLLRRQSSLSSRFIRRLFQSKEYFNTPDIICQKFLVYPAGFLPDSDATANRPIPGVRDVAVSSAAFQAVIKENGPGFLPVRRWFFRSPV